MAATTMSVELWHRPPIFLRLDFSKVVRYGIGTSLNPFEIDLHAREIGDYGLSGPFRRYARFSCLVMKKAPRMSVPVC